jgi:hypothetical protein
MDLWRIRRRADLYRRADGPTSLATIPPKQARPLPGVRLRPPWQSGTMSRVWSNGDSHRRAFTIKQADLRPFEAHLIDAYSVVDNVTRCSLLTPARPNDVNSGHPDVPHWPLPPATRHHSHFKARSRFHAPSSLLDRQSSLYGFYNCFLLMLQIIRGPPARILSSVMVHRDCPRL